MKKIYPALLGLLVMVAQVAIAQNSPVPKTAAQKPSNLRSFVRTTPQPAAPATTIPAGSGPNRFIADRCGYMTQHKKAVAAGYDKAAFERIISQKVAEIQAARLSGAARINYVIPVVFHIIHDGEAEGTGSNLSAAQVNQQIDQLNRDFGNLSGSPFPQAAASGISFCPVTVDPSGNVLTQPGINRINRISRGWQDPTTFTDQTDAGIEAMIDYIDANIKPASIWDPTRFVNIWSYNFENSGLLGYATFPTAGLPGLPAGETATTAGCVFLSGSLGSVASPGTATPYALGRTVGHEIGHFLGLYHIWGDVNNCSGTDECADTPPCSGQYFSSVPGCTIPTQCSGQPRMIQNYMDYSDDGCMNTYTQNQVDRMQAIMLAAPRRPANTSSCAVPASNLLIFTSNSTAVTETGTGASCPRTRDYQVSVKPYTAASGNATVNFSFAGSALQGFDYSVVGATSVSYVNGESATKSITIRVIDDAAVEPLENIVISYTISGTGLTGSSATHTISITDDDAIQPISNPATVTLFSQDFGTVTGSNQLPSGWVVQNAAGTTNKWVVNNAGAATYSFTGNTLHISNGNTTAVNNGTAPLSYSGVTAGTDSRAFTPAINAAGYKNINVSFKLVCNGEFDVEYYDYGIAYYTLDGLNYSALTDGSGNFILQGITANTTLSLNLPAGTVGTSNFGLLFRWISDNTIQFQPPFAVDDIVVTGQAAGVETVAAQSVSNIQTSGQTAQYVTAGGNIIATITNLNQNVGCITASVNAAGNGFTVLNTTGGSYARSNKVIQLTPASANTTATYQATFYFTTAELAAWGVDAPNLKLMKVSDATNLGTTISSAQIVTPTFSDQRSTAGYASYTGSFSGGFSKFMLVSAATALPVTTLSFEARPNEKNILLSWSTSAEYNNKGFVIERSTDGTHFETIGWKDGAGNSSITSSYMHTDNFVQPNQLYYYRLRQTDIDGREALSATRQARITDKSSLLVTISPNPASSQVKIFTAGTIGLSNINLLDAKGSLVQSWKQVNCSAAPLSLDISKVAAGIYMVQVITGDAISTQKLIIN